MFLTAADLEAMTGLRQKAAQRRWLDREGVPYTTRADGFPNVHPADLVRVRDAEPGRARPKFDAIRQAG